MRRITHLVLLFSVCGLFTSTTSKAVEIGWQTDVERAFETARQQNRPILLHFWSPDCVPCMQLEQTVFKRNDVARTLEDFFVPVKVNAREYPRLATQYRIKSVPQDVILTPSNQELLRLTTPQDPTQYVARLTAVAFKSGMTPQRRNRPEGFAGTAKASHEQSAGYQSSTGYRSPLGPPPGEPPVGMNAKGPSHDIGPIGAVTPMVNQSQPAPEAEPREVINRYATPAQATRAVTVGGSPNDSPSTPWDAQRSSPPSQQQAFAQGRNGYSSPAVNQQPPQFAREELPQQRPVQERPVPQQAQQTPFGMEGYCPVTLLKEDKWVKGDPRFGIIHRGRVYLFLSESQKATFVSSPDDFSPVLAGIDPVMLADSGEAVEGRRAFGLVYRKRVFLFNSEANLQRFWDNPEGYAAPIRQAMESGTVNRLFR